MANQQALISFLEPFVTEHKRQLFRAVLAQRTRFITVVVEDVYQSHNANAVMRSCECFGVQDVHVIEQRNTFTLSQNVNMGSAKWVSLHHHSNTPTCVEALRAQGYQIVATTPNPEAPSLYELPVNQPMALLFGTELDGLTETAFKAADIKVRIPMFGFTESFNISVSAALVLQELTRRIRQEDKALWGLTEVEEETLYLEWLKKSIKGVDRHLRAFEKKGLQ